MTVKGCRRAAFNVGNAGCSRSEAGRVAIAFLLGNDIRPIHAHPDVKIESTRRPADVFSVYPMIEVARPFLSLVQIRVP